MNLLGLNDHQAKSSISKGKKTTQYIFSPTVKIPFDKWQVALKDLWRLAETYKFSYVPIQKGMDKCEITGVNIEVFDNDLLCPVVSSEVEPQKISGVSEYQKQKIASLVGGMKPAPEPEKPKVSIEQVRKEAEKLAAKPPEIKKMIEPSLPTIPPIISRKPKATVSNVTASAGMSKDEFEYQRKMANAFTTDDLKALAKYIFSMNVSTMIGIEKTKKGVIKRFYAANMKYDDVREKMRQYIWKK